MNKYTINGLKTLKLDVMETISAGSDTERLAFIEICLFEMVVLFKNIPALQRTHPKNHQAWRDVFNWTMSYRDDADLKVRGKTHTLRC